MSVPVPASLSASHPPSPCHGSFDTVSLLGSSYASTTYVSLHISTLTISPPDAYRSKVSTARGDGETVRAELTPPLGTIGFTTVLGNSLIMLINIARCLQRARVRRLGVVSSLDYFRDVRATSHNRSPCVRLLHT